jgi:hypothetical protein
MYLSVGTNSSTVTALCSGSLCMGLCRGWPHMAAATDDYRRSRFRGLRSTFLCPSSSIPFHPSLSPPHPCAAENVHRPWAAARTMWTGDLTGWPATMTSGGPYLTLDTDPVSSEVRRSSTTARTKQIAGDKKKHRRNRKHYYLQGYLRGIMWFPM